MHIQFRGIFKFHMFILNYIRKMTILHPKRNWMKLLPYKLRIWNS